MKSNFEKVGEFHARFGLPHHGEGSPREIFPEEFLFRYQFCIEELHELLHAHRLNKREEVADSLGDLLYVVYGFAHYYRFPMDEIFDRIHKANMSKERATHASQSKRGSHLDVVKPDGWRPPNLSDLV